MVASIAVVHRILPDVAEGLSIGIPEQNPKRY